MRPRTHTHLLTLALLGLGACDPDADLELELIEDTAGHHISELIADPPAPLPPAPSCSWDSEAIAYPLPVFEGEAGYGEFTFDGNCNLVVHGGEQIGMVYRVSRTNGSVKALPIPQDVVAMYGMTYHPGDARVYISFSNELIVDNVAVDDNGIFGLDANDNLKVLTKFGAYVSSLTVAPASFGPFGGQLIASSLSPSQLMAIDTTDGTITPFAAPEGQVTVVDFDAQGTLYAIDWQTHELSTVTADGEFTAITDAFNSPRGMALAADGARVFVADRTDFGSVHELALPGGQVLSTTAYESPGGIPWGLVADADDRLLLETYDPESNNMAIMLLQY